MGDAKYMLYKRIMKHDFRAIDEIESLEEAKELIKMISGKIYLNGIQYPIEQEVDSKFWSGDKRTITEVIERFTAYGEVDIELDEDIKSEHCCKLCGSIIFEDNLEVCNKCASEYQF